MVAVVTATPLTADELEALADTHERTAAHLRELAAERRARRSRGTSRLRTSGATVTDLDTARAKQALERLGK